MSEDVGAGLQPGSDIGNDVDAANRPVGGAINGGGAGLSLAP